jgi:DNA-binding transcriptional LysR family regulator
LEEQYEVELFTRQSGRLAITDAGLKLLPEIEKLLLQSAQIESALRQSGHVNQGQLRIGATAPYYVLDIVKRYQQQYALVEVSIVNGNSRQMIQALAEYQVDLATSSHLDTDPRLLRLELGRDPLALVVHRQHALAGQKSVAIKDLAKNTLILRERGSMTRQMTEQMLEAAQVSPQDSGNCQPRIHTRSRDPPDGHQHFCAARSIGPPGPRRAGSGRRGSLSSRIPVLPARAARCAADSAISADGRIRERLIEQFGLLECRLIPDPFRTRKKRYRAGATQ